MNPPTPSIETLAGLYRAAHMNVIAADLGMDRITRSIEHHGFSVEEVKKAAGLATEPVTFAMDRVPSWRRL